MTATETLRRLLDERGVEWEDFDGEPTWADGDGRMYYARQEFTFAGLTDEVTVYHLTPEQAVEATLGRVAWSNPTWERWHQSLKHESIETIGDAVEQLMYEAIEFGGDMGPNGNTYNGIDEGDVLTAGYINEWVERFENTLEPGTCKPVISDNLTESEGTGDAWADCSECGHLLFVLTDPNSTPPNYCPNCGRKVVDA